MKVFNSCRGSLRVPSKTIPGNYLRNDLSFVRVTCPRWQQTQPDGPVLTRPAGFAFCGLSKPWCAACDCRSGCCQAVPACLSGTFTACLRHSVLLQRRAPWCPGSLVASKYLSGKWPYAPHTSQHPEWPCWGRQLGTGLGGRPWRGGLQVERQALHSVLRAAWPGGRRAWALGSGLECESRLHLYCPTLNTILDLVSCFVCDSLKNASISFAGCFEN